MAREFSEPNVPPDAERAFVEAVFQDHFAEAKQVIGANYLGEQSAEDFVANCEIHFTSTNDGLVIPKTLYDNRSRKFDMRVNPESVMAYAAEFSEEIDDVNQNDVVKLIIGAGVGRVALGYMLLPIRWSDTIYHRNALQERLCDKGPLLSAVEMHEVTEPNLGLSASINRLGDDEISRINILRFAVGIALNHLFDTVDLQQRIPKGAIRRLHELQQARNLDLRTAMAILDSMKNAFEYYDGTIPEEDLALAFPMTPGEELDSFAFSSQD